MAMVMLWLCYGYVMVMLWLCYDGLPDVAGYQMYSNVVSTIDRWLARHRKKICSWTAGVASRMWCLCLDCECQCQCRSHAVGPRECSPITVHSTSILWDHLCWSLFGSSNSMSPGQENGDVLMHRYIVEDWTCDVWVNWSITKWSPDIKKIARSQLCQQSPYLCSQRMNTSSSQFGQNCWVMEPFKSNSAAF